MTHPKSPDTQNKPIKFESLLKIYDSMAASYDRITEQTKYEVPRRLMQMAQDLLSEKRQVLDLGCGNGILGRTFKSAGADWKFSGVDFSQSMLDECKRLSNYESLFQADMNYGVPSIKAGSFDMAIACGLSEFVEDLTLLLKEINRILCATGVILIAFEKTTETSSPRGQIRSGDIPKYHYSYEEAQNHLERAGFKIQSADEFDAYVSPTTGNSIRYLLFRASKL